ncbi:HET-domain-containing protein [Xylariaceae sp. FL0255]|nr:HET-domain-containing protein [Xylariaceae sp. FL0255]
MHLLNAKTLELREFLRKPPAYAILSHTWEDGEVSFQDISGPNALTKKGFAKIKACCEQALRDGLEWAWIDTCCINKDSSTVLSEAINSMYRWYQESAVCYAYLADIHLPNPDLLKLIAPRRLEFFNSQWMPLGSKRVLLGELTSITRVDMGNLVKYDHSSVNAGLVFSWASKRETTREEDMAYCLLGLLDINMPLLYGEGRKAFIRLQQEVVRQSDDYSIFIKHNMITIQRR